MKTFKNLSQYKDLLSHNSWLFNLETKYILVQIRNTLGSNTGKCLGLQMLACTLFLLCYIFCPYWSCSMRPRKSFNYPNAPFVLVMCSIPPTFSYKRYRRSSLRNSIPMRLSKPCEKYKQRQSHLRAVPTYSAVVHENRYRRECCPSQA